MSKRVMPLLLLGLLFAACSPLQPSATPTEEALFTDADIAGASLELAAYSTLLEGSEGAVLPAGAEYDLSAAELSLQAVLEGVDGQLAYIRHNPNVSAAWAVFIADQASDSNSRVYSGTRAIDSVALNADGDRLLLAMMDGDHYQVYRLDLSDSSITKLTDAAQHHTNVSMSRDGSVFAWEASGATGRRGITLREYSGESFTQSFLGNNFSAQVEPSLSSDGQKVVFVRQGNRNSDNFRRILAYERSSNLYSNIFTLDVAGLELRHPSISDNGKIVWIQNLPDGTSLLRLRETTGTIMTLQRSSETLEHAHITADGQFLTYGVSNTTRSFVMTRDLSANIVVRNAVTILPVSNLGMIWQKAIPVAPETRSIEGVLWHDRNANGVQDTDEPLLGGKVVFLDSNGNGTLDTGEVSTTTAADGSYRFEGLNASASYTVTQALGIGWTNTFPTASSSPAQYLATILQSPVTLSTLRAGEKLEGEDDFAYPFIVGGTPATLGEFPFMAAIVTPPGQPSGFGCSRDNIRVFLVDSATSALHSSCRTSGTEAFIIDGSYRPWTALNTFNGQPLGGTWTLFVSDAATPDPGTLLSWSIIADGETYTSSPNRAIPDGNAAGISDTLTIPDSGTVNNMTVRLNITHTWVGDLTVRLTNNQTGTTITLVRRPGTGTTTTYSQFCGGALVASRWVVTASHCVEGNDLENTAVRLNSDQRSTGGQMISVSRIIMHPDYSVPVELNNDIALLELSQPVMFQRVPLLTAELAAMGLADPGISATVTGWGATSEGGSASNQLLKVNVPIVSNATCAVPYDAYWGTGTITDQMICAGNMASGGIDSCQGDSGGPFMVRNSDNSGYLHAGVVSFGLGCARPNYPGIYARTSVLMNFINDNVIPEASNSYFVPAGSGVFSANFGNFR